MKKIKKVGLLEMLEAMAAKAVGQNISLSLGLKLLKDTAEIRKKTVEAFFARKGAIKIIKHYPDGKYAEELFEEDVFK